MAKIRSRALSVVAIFSALGPFTVAQAQPCTGWELRATSGPSPRFRHSLAYDSARQVTVLFGGMTSGFSYKSDTWEWDGNTWTFRAMYQPSQREGAAMAYDSGRGVIVLFGGDFFGSQNGETWEWDGTSWSMRSTSGPPPRFGHAMAYDSRRKVTVLFGGAAGFFLDDGTWEWDGTSWTQRPGGPPIRYDHAMAYDAARGVTVMFGGNSWKSGSFIWLADTWEWDGIAWKRRADDGPTQREGHGMAYDSARRVTVLFGGGGDGGGYDATWEWDGWSWARRASSGPSIRSLTAMAYDSARGVAVLFGGLGSSDFGDTWEWDGRGDPAHANYGSGWPGTNGTPGLTTASDPALCTTISVDVGNSLGASTLVALVLGLGPTDQGTAYDGHLLVIPLNIALRSLPAAGLAISGTLPCDPALCGRAIYLQALELDPGASAGVSFSPGLRLVLGS